MEWLPVVLVEASLKIYKAKIHVLYTKTFLKGRSNIIKALSESYKHQGNPARSQTLGQRGAEWRRNRYRQGLLPAANMFTLLIPDPPIL